MKGRLAGVVALAFFPIFYKEDALEGEKMTKVEVFTGSCPFCRDTVALMKTIFCPDCEVVVYDLNKEGAEKAKEYRVYSAPTIVVDGTVVYCCKSGEVIMEELKKVLST